MACGAGRGGENGTKTYVSMKRRRNSVGSRNYQRKKWNFPCFFFSKNIYHSEKTIKTTAAAAGGGGSTAAHFFWIPFIKTCPPDKLHNGFGFVVQFLVGIRYLSCRQGGKFWKKGIQNVTGSGFAQTHREVNRLTAMVSYMRPLFFWASYELNNFSNFCPLSTFDS